MISIIVTALLSTSLGQAPQLSPNPLENTINILRADGVTVRDRPDTRTLPPVLEATFPFFVDYIGANPASGNSAAGASGSTYGGAYNPGNAQTVQYAQAGNQYAQAGSPAGYGYGGGMASPQGYPPMGPPMNCPPGYGQGQGQGQGPGGVGIGVSGYAPCPGSPGCQWCFGTTIGPWPGTAAGPRGPYPCGFEQPAVFMPNKVTPGTSAGQDKERKEQEKERKDLKTSLDKLTESIQQLEKRVESGEKLSQSTEAKVKWLEEEMKRRLFWHDLEDKLDRRVKPLEDSIRHLSKRMEELHRQPGTLSPASPLLPGEAKGDSALSRQLENFQANISKEISSISLRLEQVEEILKEERAARMKLEDRIKLHEEKGHKRDRAPMLPDLPNKDKIDGPKEDKDLPSKDKIDAPKENKDLPSKDKTDKDLPNKDNKEPSKEIDKENLGGIPQISVGRNGVPQANVPGDKALVVVSLPADAKLFLNNQPTRSQGTVRKFLTPALEPGATFTYVLRAEVVQNGQVRVQTQQITFQAGRQANVTFVPTGDTRVAGSK